MGPPAHDAALVHLPAQAPDASHLVAVQGVEVLRGSDVHGTGAEEQDDSEEKEKEEGA